MGQVQRKNQQGIELWELYEEEERATESGRGSRRNSQRSGRDVRRTRGTGADEYGRERRRSEEYGRDGVKRRAGSYGREETGRRTGGYGREEARRRAGGYGREEAGRRTDSYEREEAGRRAGRYGREEAKRRTGGYRREEAAQRADRSGHDGERRRAGRSGSNIRMYDMQRSGPRTGGGVSGSTGRPAVNTGRQYENTAGGRRTGRSGEVSQISCIRPYPAADRRKEPEYAYRGNARPVQSIKRRRARRRREFLCKAAIALFSVACLAMIYVLTGQIYQMVHKNTREKPLPVMTEQVSNDISSDGTGIAPPEVIQNFLEINEYSRPGDKLSKVNSIFVHYTANPGTSAAQNRSYFANLAETHERSASAHLIIGYEGELIQCIPFDEQAYAVMTRNEDSISIECCYLSDDGSFTQETYDTLIHTLAWLTDKYDLSTEDILRHYDCGGKLCPLYYAENESAWSQLRQDVEAYLAQARQESAEL